ncbi:MAG TPA: hypothetical protein DCS60_01710 [Opitutae bacterium]|nr:hypothetical protein [Opitutae bacterium]
MFTVPDQALDGKSLNYSNQHNLGLIRTILIYEKRVAQRGQKEREKRIGAISSISIQRSSLELTYSLAKHRIFSW